MSTPRRVAERLAEVWADGPWTATGLIDRGSAVLGARPDWLDGLVQRVLAASPTRPRVQRVIPLIRDDAAFLAAWDEAPIDLAAPLSIPGPVMSPSPGPAETWGVPAILSRDDLAARLGLGPEELAWFADLQGRNRAVDGPLGHYDYHWTGKRDGSARLVEVPRPRLRQIQRRLLREIIGRIPPHDAAHGFRVGRSVGSFVAPHAGRAVVLRLDLRDFFPSVGRARVAAVFRAAGYPNAVVATLAGLCTNRVPAGVWRRGDAPPAVVEPSPDAWLARKRFAEPHLPQGAPTSPALANLVAFRLDRRLTALARSVGAAYTRYADDLAFSGQDGFRRVAERFAIEVQAVALDEGFAIHPRKTRVMRPGGRQVLAGVVLNDRPNIARSTYDDLKATLHNCARHGPAGQNRAGRDDFRAHLLGRIGHVATLNPTRADRLRTLFDRIAW